ncbi:unnamed protein product [Brassica oleracea]
MYPIITNRIWKTSNQMMMSSIFFATLLNVEEEQYYRDLSLLAEHEHDAVETWDVATGAHSVLRPDSAASEEMALAWVGLGYNREIDTKKIERSAVIHFNGHSKPWTELGISKYQPYWIKYIDLDHPYISSCRLFE